MIDFNALAEPFPPNRIHWRVGQKSQDGKKGMVLAYLDARDVMNRLDEVVGPENWEDNYEETRSGRVLCDLRIRVNEDTKWGDWVGKSDGAGDTSFEGAKGAISDAFKRAAVKWGIGRYLYECKAPWIDLDNGYIPKNFDGSQYLTAFSSKQMKTKYYKLFKEHAGNDDAMGVKELVAELNQEQQLEIWQDLSSGIRSTIKRLLEEEDG